MNISSGSDNTIPHASGEQAINGDNEPFLSDEVLDLLRGLAQLVDEGQLSEVELTDNNLHLALRAEPEAIALATTAALPDSSSHFVQKSPVAKPDTEQLTPIEAPMVGVFFRSPSPNDPPFVEVGDRVEIGQTIGIIEAMKVFNEITSEVEGHVAQIVVGNAELVETGSTIMLIRQ